MEISFGNSFQKAYKKKIKNTAVEPEFWAVLDVLLTPPSMHV